jgi:hypothetical protein
MSAWTTLSAVCPNAVAPSLTIYDVRQHSTGDTDFDFALTTSGDRKVITRELYRLAERFGDIGTVFVVTANDTSMTMNVRQLRSARRETDSWRTRGVTDGFTSHLERFDETIDRVENDTGYRPLIGRRFDG